MWISGDTVLYDERPEGPGAAADRHGAAAPRRRALPGHGPLRYTMTAGEAVELCGLAHPHTAIPIHYEGWKHFREGRAAAERAFAAAPAEVRDSVRWLPIGEAATLDP